MSNTEKRLETFVSINPINVLDDVYDTLMINVHYIKGMGLDVSIKPICRNAFGYSCTFSGVNRESGFNFITKRLTRKSREEEEKLFNVVDSMKEEIADFYNKWNGTPADVMSIFEKITCSVN